MHNRVGTQAMGMPCEMLFQNLFHKEETERGFILSVSSETTVSCLGNYPGQRSLVRID